MKEFTIAFALFVLLSGLHIASAQRRGACVPLNNPAATAFCGEFTPAKVCTTSTSSSSSTFFPTSPTTFDQAEFDYLTSYEYQHDNCPLHPASYPTPLADSDNSKEAYCRLGSCIDDSDCTSFTQRQCFSYCTYCHGSTSYCDSLVDDGIVAPLGDVANCWEGKMELGGSGSKGDSSGKVRWIIAGVVVGILGAVVIVSVLGTYLVKRYRRRRFEEVGVTQGGSNGTVATGGGTTTGVLTSSGIGGGGGSLDHVSGMTRFRLTDEDEDEEAGFDEGTNYDEVDLDAFVAEEEEQQQKRRRAALRNSGTVRLTFSQQD